MRKIRWRAFLLLIWDAAWDRSRIWIRCSRLDWCYQMIWEHLEQDDTYWYRSNERDTRLSHEMYDDMYVCLSNYATRERCYIDLNRSDICFWSWLYHDIFSRSSRKSRLETYKNADRTMMTRIRKWKLFLTRRLSSRNVRNDLSSR